ncbi:hypothetical protein SAMN04488024_101664 [Pedobacter soli]|uniref:Uncharacterized protein n=1 Tax=Pedobacter soli TaxID=390242 RepID=A0A1G6K5F5_9SPHI|nr:hypothetical protein SAMN04488024_101664 [Pedobacter soli]
MAKKTSEEFLGSVIVPWKQSRYGTVVLNGRGSSFRLNRLSEDNQGGN